MSGLTTGLSGMGAGWAIGVVGDAAVRAYSKQSRIFIGMVLILIFAEVLGMGMWGSDCVALYGLIVSLILNTKAGVSQC